MNGIINIAAVVGLFVIVSGIFALAGLPSIFSQ